IGLCLAVGSPALITYSLALTLFNRSWAVKQVQRLLDRSVRRRQHLPAALAHTAAEFEQFEVRLQSFLSLAVEGQQVPLRASVVRHWLSSLIVSPANTAWWATVRERVRLSRRRPTLSLHAQISLAGIVWVFTIFTGVSAAVGAINTAIEIATSTLWVWLVSDAFLGLDVPHRCFSADSVTETGPQEAIFVESGLTREPAAAVTQHGQLHPASNHLLEPPKTLGMDTRGDEAKEGPVYTYARVFTWWAFTRRILDAFETTLDKMVENRQCREMPNPVAIEQQQPPPANPPQPNNNNNNNKPPPTPPRMLGFPQAGDPAPVRAYSRLRDVETAVWARMRDALAVALFAQWGTTGAAVVIAYNTPMVGWGCRSGSYLLYGLLGTAALACLLRSALLSHLAMRMYQQAYVAGWMHWGLCALANLTRLVGKFIAVANAVILVLIGVFEFVGLFDNCWCKACYLQYGDSGYAVLFRSDADYRKLAQGAWVGGIIMATVVSIMLCCLFYFPSRSKLR
ncbi:uncharacterized protein THITE_2053488, partial [Thermothielavioides terrestris NRRL 8126]